MARISGRSAFLALLEDEGVTHLFGNPGTTELPIMHALREHPGLTYVMAMQESVVVAIADGFSRASGRLVACNVHVAPGLGNAMGALFNCKFTGTPLIAAWGPDPSSVIRARVAMEITFFHWGLMPWALYTVAGLILRWEWGWASRIEGRIGHRWPWLSVEQDHVGAGGRRRENGEA